MLHRFGHGLLVILVACLCLMPARAQAATIDLGTFSSGSVNFSGDFTFDNDIALIFLSLLGTAVVSAEITSHLGSDDPGFDPILTLFEAGSDFLNGYNYLFDGSDGFLDPSGDGTRSVTLSAGNYVLAISQYSNYYFPGLGFEQDTAEDGLFTYALFGGADTTCSAFVAWDGGCRSSRFAGTLSIQPENVQPVPEPGSLALLAAGGAALLARRRHWKRPGASDRV